MPIIQKRSRRKEFQNGTSGWGRRWIHDHLAMCTRQIDGHWIAIACHELERLEQTQYAQNEPKKNNNNKNVKMSDTIYFLVLCNVSEWICSVWQIFKNLPSTYIGDVYCIYVFEMWHVVWVACMVCVAWGCETDRHGIQPGTALLSHVSRTNICTSIYGHIVHVRTILFFIRLFRTKKSKKREEYKNWDRHALDSKGYIQLFEVAMRCICVAGGHRRNNSHGRLHIWNSFGPNMPTLFVWVSMALWNIASGGMGEHGTNWPHGLALRPKQ